MTARTAEEWGRVAVSLPGWRWMAGMLDTEGARMAGTDPTTGEYLFSDPADEGGDVHYVWPDHQVNQPNPDDPATAGCLLTMLEAATPNWCHHPTRGRYLNFGAEWGRDVVFADTLGRACIAAAEALGRWPS